MISSQLLCVELDFPFTIPSVYHYHRQMSRGWVGKMLILCMSSPGHRVALVYDANAAALPPVGTLPPQQLPLSSKG